VPGRQLAEADLDEIRAMRAEHPEWSRLQLSVALAERWQWRNGVGRLKDMAARTMPLKLQARGLIQLPPPLQRRGRRRAQAPPAQTAVGFALWPERIARGLDGLRPVELELVERLAPRRRGKWRRGTGSSAGRTGSGPSAS
jgi:hypothetical protein